MRIEFFEHCNLMIYKWHSINLVPSLSRYNIASNDKIDSQTGCKVWDGTLVGRCIEILFFGIVFSFMYPNTKFKKQDFGNLRGPLWSRRRHCWYTVKD